MEVTRTEQPPQPPQSTPHLAVVFHQCNDLYDRPSIIGATKHKIVDGVIQSGRFASLHEVRELFHEKTDRASTPTILPSNVLIDSPETLMWHKKSFKAQMWFRTQANSENFNVVWCNLLFIVNKTKSRLHVYALASGSRPDMETRVYQAPLMNIYQSGLVCQGTAKLPDEIGVDHITEIEDTIIKSNFTHVNHNHCLKAHTTTSSLIKYWRNLSKSNAKVKASDLRYISSLGDLINSRKRDFGV